MTAAADDSPDPRTRSIRLEVEVPGTPEEVWESIATGHGISAWFVPTEVEGRPGGRVHQHFGPGMEAEGTVTAFEPPHRFAFQGEDEGGPPLAFEFLVEARGGGTCVVRLVNSGFGSGEAWDDQYDGMTEGWKLFLHNLLLHRTHFPGQRCASVLVNGMAAGSNAEVWARYLDALGITDPVEGARVDIGAPRLAGSVERVRPGMLTLLLEAPAAGVGFVAAEGRGPVSTSAYLYLYGETAEATAERERVVWSDWMGSHFGGD